MKTAAPAATGPTVAAAEEVLRLAQVEPKAAKQQAEALLAGAGDDRAGKEVSAVAARALGVAARELDELPVAVAHLERAVLIAESAAMPVRAAEARMSLSLTLSDAGQCEQALQQADLAVPALRGVDAAVLDMQRAIILQRLGRLDAALDGYRRALPVIRRAGDATNEARLLMNRGVLQAYRGQFRAGEADLKRAADRFERLGQPLYAAKARHNIGFVVARRGDVAAALRWYDRAELGYRRLGVSPGVPLLDRCETLLSVRLVPEARDAGRRAAAELEASGMEADLAQALLLLAEAALLAGDVAESADLAGRARRLLVRQRRPGWAALARYAWLRATWAAGDRSARTLRASGDTVDELLAAGWVGPAVDARLIRARLALALGRVQLAQSELSEASRGRRSGPPEMRARAWHAEALLRHARGDGRGTETALRTGLRILARHQATLGATEIRAHGAARAEELASLGIQIALESGRGDRVLAWAERWRAGALRSRPVMPSPDADVTGLLAELREVARLLEGAEPAHTARLLRRQAAVEADIRRTTWYAEGDPDPTVDRPPSLRALAQALGDVVLVELVELDGWLHAVTVAAGRATLHRRLAPVATVGTEVDALRFALTRLARSPVPGSLAAQAFDHACRELDSLLVSPLRGRLRDRALVIVPTGVLHGLPWSTLPSLRGRPVTVAPSAALWLRARSTTAPTGNRTVLVAGPGLANARREVTELSRLYPAATTLVGPAARTASVSTSLGDSDLVHIAAHGTFRADNPLFSSLRLVDGPLTVYDLERLGAAPRRMVLSACDAGQSLVASGDELMGLSAALLSLGTTTLVASVATVSDDVTSAMMVALHRALVGGKDPAEALADTQAAFRRDGNESLARTAGFACLGAG